MNLSETFYRGIAETMWYYCDKHEIPNFIGGSRRFEFYTNESDLDIFVYLKDQNIQKHLGEFFDMGFRSDVKSDMYPGEVLSFHGIIHVAILKDLGSFVLLQKNHDRVAKYLIENITFREFARSLKCRGVKGSLIYRSLLDLAKK